MLPRILRVANISLLHILHQSACENAMRDAEIVQPNQPPSIPPIIGKRGYRKTYTKEGCTTARERGSSYDPRELRACGCADWDHVQLSREYQEESSVHWLEVVDARSTYNASGMTTRMSGLSRNIEPRFALRHIREHALSAFDDKVLLTPASLIFVPAGFGLGFDLTRNRHVSAQLSYHPKLLMDCHSAGLVDGNSVQVHLSPDFTPSSKVSRPETCRCDQSLWRVL